MPDHADTLLLITVLVFACVGLLVFAAVGALSQRERIRRRYAALSSDGHVPLEDAGDQPWVRFDPGRFGLDLRAQRALRTELVKAGFFSASGVGIYAAVRLALLVGLPLVGDLVIPLVVGRWGIAEMVALAAVLAAVAYVLPKSYLSQRQRRLEARYRAAFPDLLDMLVVCINAGLSLEAALDRAAREMGDSEPELRANFDLMAGEMRAGKSTPDALKALAERLGLREARSFAALLQQTIELGTDVAQALTIFSDEMRDKRMARAEERAAALAPKLTLPLGLFIFPVVLIAVLAPAILKIMHVVAP